MSDSAESVVLFDDHLRVQLPSAGHADFHYRWLRHNCDVDRHPQTRERIVDSSELPAELRATSAQVRDGALVVTWAHDGRESRYKLEWLIDHAYALNRPHVAPPPSDLAPVTLWRSGRSLPAVVADAIALVHEHGIAVVRRDPASVTPPEDETESIIDAFAETQLRVIGTHFGRIEDLRTDNTTNQNTDQLGYTDAAVELHTDQPFIEKPPRYQLLQSIRPAQEGGDNFVVDALLAEHYLRSLDAHAAHLLRTVPVNFHRKQKAFESLVISPILSGEGDDFQIRYSYFTMAPYKRPFAEMTEWYRAYDAFARLVRDQRHQYRFRLEPGDFLLYNNHRMLHARTSFRGSRWVRGIYFDR